MAKRAKRRRGDRALFEKRGIFYYHRQVGGERVRRSTGCTDLAAAIAWRDEFERRAALGGGPVDAPPSASPTTSAGAS